MKTIKELEKSIGVSKVSLYSMVKKIEFRPHVFKDLNNTMLIDEAGEKLLRAYYLKEQSETINDILSETIEYEKETSEDINFKCSDSDIDSDLSKLKSLDFMVFLQEQIKIKDDTINSLLSLLSNQQKLQMTNLITHNKTVSPVTDTPTSSPSVKRWLFSRIFKRQAY